MSFFFEQALDEVYAIIRQNLMCVKRKDKWLLPDVMSDLLRCLVDKGSVSKNHLVNEDSCGPPVNILVIAMPCDYFGRLILISATVCAGHLLVLQLSGKAKVYHFQVAI